MFLWPRGSINYIPHLWQVVFRKCIYDDIYNLSMMVFSNLCWNENSIFLLIFKIIFIFLEITFYQPQFSL